MTDTEDVPEEVKDLHNKMVYILGGEIGPNSGTLLRLIGLFSDNPLTAAERSNTKCIEDLMEILMIYRKIAYGQYKPLIDKLKLVHPRMRTVVINFAVQMSTAIGNHTRGENSSISKRKFTVVSGSSASSQPFMFPGQGQSLGDGIQSSMEVDGASGGQRCIDQAVTCVRSRQGASVQVIQATNELPRTDEEWQFYLDWMSDKLPTEISTVASHLRISSDKQKQIETDNNVKHEQCFHMLWEWFRKSTERDTDKLTELHEALLAAGRKDITDDDMPQKTVYRFPGGDDQSLKRLVTEIDLLNVSKDIGAEYPSLVRYFGIKEGEIHASKHNKERIQDQAKDVLLKCFKQTLLQTRKQLCDGLFYKGRRDIIDMLIQGW